MSFFTDYFECVNAVGTSCSEICLVDLMKAAPFKVAVERVFIYEALMKLSHNNLDVDQTVAEPPDAVKFAAFNIEL